jgi:hypothetical protein
MENLSSPMDHKLLGFFAAGGLLQGVGSVASKIEPALSSILIAAQILVAILTALLIWKKLKKK